MFTRQHIYMAWHDKTEPMIPVALSVLEEKNDKIRDYKLFIEKILGLNINHVKSALNELKSINNNTNASLSKNNLTFPLIPSPSVPPLVATEPQQIPPIQQLQPISISSPLISSSIPSSLLPTIQQLQLCRVLPNSISALALPPLSTIDCATNSTVSGMTCTTSSADGHIKEKRQDIEWWLYSNYTFIDNIGGCLAIANMSNGPMNNYNVNNDHNTIKSELH